MISLFLDHNEMLNFVPQPTLSLINYNLCFYYHFCSDLLSQEINTLVIIQ